MNRRRALAATRYAHQRYLDSLGTFTSTLHAQRGAHELYARQTCCRHALRIYDLTRRAYEADYATWATWPRARA